MMNCPCVLLDKTSTIMYYDVYHRIADRASGVAHRASRIAHRASRIAHRASRIAHRASRIAHRASRITLALRIATQKRVDPSQSSYKCYQNKQSVLLHVTCRPMDMF